MSFTPGPWRWHDELILAGGHDRQGKCIVEAPGCFHFECDPESEANANLISAAPDLLAACEAMIDVDEPTEAIYHQVVAAIAKAKG